MIFTSWLAVSHQSSPGIVHVFQNNCLLIPSKMVQAHFVDHKAFFNKNRAITGKKKYFLQNVTVSQFILITASKFPDSCSTICLGCKLSVMTRLFPKYMHLWLHDFYIFMSQQTRLCIMEACRPIEASCKTYNTRNPLLLQPKQLLPARFNEKYCAAEVLRYNYNLMHQTPQPARFFTHGACMYTPALHNVFNRSS